MSSRTRLEPVGLSTQLLAYLPPGQWLTTAAVERTAPEVRGNNGETVATATLLRRLRRAGHVTSRIAPAGKQWQITPKGTTAAPRTGVANPRSTDNTEGTTDEHDTDRA